MSTVSYKNVANSKMTMMMTMIVTRTPWTVMISNNILIVSPDLKHKVCYIYYKNNIAQNINTFFSFTWYPLQKELNVKTTFPTFRRLF